MSMLRECLIAVGRQGLGRRGLAGQSFCLGRTHLLRRRSPLAAQSKFPALVNQRWFSSVYSAASTLLPSRVTPVALTETRRPYGTEKPLTATDLKRRVLDVCKAFDKINADKLMEDSHFMNDLGLDSLDQVELIMAMEDEFGFEIPDADAEKLLRPIDVIKYVAGKEHVDG